MAYPFYPYSDKLQRIIFFLFSLPWLDMVLLIISCSLIFLLSPLSLRLHFWSIFFNCFLFDFVNLIDLFVHFQLDLKPVPILTPPVKGKLNVFPTSLIFFPNSYFPFYNPSFTLVISQFFLMHFFQLVELNWILLNSQFNKNSA